MKTAFIYGLYEAKKPRTIVYVGATTDPNKRLSQHKQAGRNFKMRILERCSLKERDERERHWISFYFQKNRKMLNVKWPARSGDAKCITVTMNAITRVNLEQEAIRQRVRACDVGRQAIIDYLAAKERDRATV
jgi:GIY-YIG catalytic domain-containing protein